MPRKPRQKPRPLLPFLRNVPRRCRVTSWEVPETSKDVRRQSQKLWEGDLKKRTNAKDHHS